jgi:hypothetical protein
MADFDTNRANWPIQGEKVFYYDDSVKTERSLTRRIAELEERLAVVTEAMERFSKEMTERIDRLSQLVG